MTEFVNEINYDKLIEKALKQVVVEALKIAENKGFRAKTISISLSGPITPVPLFRETCLFSTLTV